MCLAHRQSCNIAVANGFKVFSRDNAGRLRSAFWPGYRDELWYTPNVRLNVIPDEAVFFSFLNEDDAWKIIRDRREWNLVSRDNLTVRPVVLYDVVAQGRLQFISNDPQVLDGYYASFESKGIMVVDKTWDIAQDIAVNRHLVG